MHQLAGEIFNFQNVIELKSYNFSHWLTYYDANALLIATQMAHLLWRQCLTYCDANGWLTVMSMLGIVCLHWLTYCDANGSLTVTSMVDLLCPHLLTYCDSNTWLTVSEFKSDWSLSFWCMHKTCFTMLGTLIFSCFALNIDPYTHSDVHTHFDVCTHSSQITTL